MAAAPTYPVAVIAQLLKLTERRVQQLSVEGIIPKPTKGKYQLAPSVQGYVGYLQKVAAAKPQDVEGLGAEKLRLMRANADLAEMAVQKERRELVPATEISAAWAAVSSEIRSNLLNAVPTRVASGIKGLRADAKIRLVVRSEIIAALSALSTLDDAAVLGGDDGDAV
jgi:phage terminase Nu1 subunit (DNA packaging protein)